MAFSNFMQGGLHPTNEGEIQVRNKEGQLFLIKSLQENTSPLAVPCLNLGVSTQEIIDTVREIRELY
jgi:hypothetical protein